MLIKLVIVYVAIQVIKSTLAQEELFQDDDITGGNWTDVRNSAIESLFGQVAKTVIYGGAKLASLNNRLLCSMLTFETQQDNEEQPVLYLFKSYAKLNQAFKIYSDDDIIPQMLDEVQFDRNQSTIILVHGWLGGIHNEVWLSETKDVVLKYNDAIPIESKLHNAVRLDYSPNVIVVDWSDLAAGALYTATRNSQRVSRRLGRLLAQLADIGGLRPELMHCMGHSLGAHICGQAARYAFPAQPQPAGSGRQSLLSRRRFGRITGLDPGGFCYEPGIRNESTYFGLKPSDALLVDAYHSNRAPFGNRYQVAHYNVRLNNGYFQRPCSVWRNPQVSTEYFRAAVRFILGNVGHNDILTCDHYFATRFAHQIPQPHCSYIGYSCDSYRSFTRGRCGQCSSPEQCYPIEFEYQRFNASNGHFLDHIQRYSSLLSSHTNGHGQAVATDGIVPPGGVPYEQRGVYYMRVDPNEPYCSCTYRVRAILNLDTIRDLRGFRSDSMELQLLGVVTLRDSSTDRLTGGTLILHGPWLDADPETNYGLDNRTLTGLFELKRPERIRGVQIVYDSGRRQNPLGKPVESVHFEYLSSLDEEIKARYSSSFDADEIEVRYRILKDLLD